MADEMKATPVKNKQAAGVAGALQGLHSFVSKPFGYDNPPGQMLSQFVGIPDIASALERIGYGEPLTTGSGQTLKLRDDVLNAIMAIAPFAQATKGLSVGAATKSPIAIAELEKLAKIKAEMAAKNAADEALKPRYNEAVKGQTKKQKPLSFEEWKAINYPEGTQGLQNALQKETFKYPQEEAMRLAQQRAALPIEQGGLGLPANNTATDRAKALGGKDMVHFSRTGGDYTTLDSGKFAIAPFDAVGTHVGTPQAAMDRFRNTTATTDEIKGTTYPVTILGDRPLMNQNNMPWGEDDLSAFLRKEGGHNWSDIHGGKMTYQDMNANLRNKLFEEQGYTSIPYFNEVEGKGSVSFIVPPENIRSRFAAFDPFRKTAATAAAMGVAAPDLLAKEAKEKKKAAGGAVFNTDPDMSDGGRIIEGAPFKKGGNVNLDAIYMAVNDAKFRRK